MIKEYKEFVETTAKDGNFILTEMGGEKADLMHMALLLADECGELVSPIKKHVCYNQDLDVENVKEEIGDLMYALFRIMNICDLDFESVLIGNQIKLKRRYEDGYTDEEAELRRDKQ